MAKLASKDRFFSRDEVENHNKGGDIWLIIDCVVYDVSNWIHKHPGIEFITFHQSVASFDFLKNF